MPQLNFETHGDKSNPAVMLVHGFMSCNAQWWLNRDALSERFFLVAVELWGHGGSPEPGDATYYSIAAYVEQFDAIRASLGLKTWSLIGQSYGAGLALSYACTHPEHTERVVVTNSRSAFGSLNAEDGAKPKESVSEKAFDPRALPYHPVHARRFPEHVKTAMVEQADQITARAIKLGGMVGDLNFVERLDQVPVPVLLTNGKFEKRFQPEVEKLRNRYPDIKIAHLDGGHSVNVEAPDGFNSAVLDFLDGEAS